MTIKGSKGPGAAIALVGATVVVMLITVSAALGQPRLLLIGGLFAVLEVATVLFLLRPTSLMFDGADLVYRVGGRQTRVARDTITNCAPVGQQWVFSDAAGAQILSLPMLRFNQADLAAFCNQFGLRGFTPPLRPVDQSRKDVTSAKSTRAWGVVLTLITLSLTVFSIWLSVSAQDALSRYRSAPICEGASTASTCRLQTQARVTSTEENRNSTTLHLSLVGSGGDYIASVNKAGAPSTGDIVSAEVWDRKVTRLGDAETLGNPELNPNLHINGVLVGVALFLFLGVPMGMAVVGQVQLRSARGRLRAAAAVDSSSAGPVELVHADAPIDAEGLPPCGIDHHPKEVFFAHWDPATLRTGLIVASVIAAIVLTVLVALAITVSAPIFGAIAVVVLAWFGLNVFGEWRETRVGGVFADDLHVGKITTSNGRLVRKVYSRTSVLELSMRVQLSVVGVDGSTLFLASGLSAADTDRFAAFLGCRVVRDVAPAQPDPIAAVPVQTPLGVLPLRVRRAAGVMQTFGGLMLGLGLINIPLLVRGLPADRQLQVLELLAGIVVYGGVMAWLGWRLARGRPRSREAALIGGAVVTICLVVFQLLLGINPVVTAFFAAITLITYGFMFSWLRKPLTKDPPAAPIRP